MTSEQTANGALPEQPKPQAVPERGSPTWLFAERLNHIDWWATLARKASDNGEYQMAGRATTERELLCRQLLSEIDGKDRSGNSDSET